jgi:phosphopantetheine adenylyltransferase
MSRHIIDRDELLRIINEHLESVPACRNLHISGIGVDPTRQHGGNWIATGLRRSGDDHDENACSDEIRQFMADLQARYDIAT